MTDNLQHHTLQDNHGISLVVSMPRMMLDKMRTNMNSNGQVMIFVVMAMGGLLFAATAIAGLLMIYQVRQAADIKNSTKAVYAADAAMEWGSYQLIATTTTSTFADAKVHSATLCYNAEANVINCEPPPPLDCLKSTFMIRGFGRVKDAYRTFSQVPPEPSVGCTATGGFQ